MGMPTGIRSALVLLARESREGCKMRAISNVTEDLFGDSQNRQTKRSETSRYLTPCQFVGLLKGATLLPPPSKDW